MIRAHILYEGVYLLGTSIARPLIAKDRSEYKKFDFCGIAWGNWKRK